MCAFAAWLLLPLTIPVMARRPVLHYMYESSVSARDTEDRTRAPIKTPTKLAPKQDLRCSHIFRISSWKGCCFLVLPYTYKDFICILYYTTLSKAGAGYDQSESKTNKKASTPAWSTVLTSSSPNHVQSSSGYGVLSSFFDHLYSKVQGNTHVEPALFICVPSVGCQRGQVGASIEDDEPGAALQTHHHWVLNGHGVVALGQFTAADALAASLACVVWADGDRFPVPSVRPRGRGTCRRHDDARVPLVTQCAVHVDRRKEVVHGPVASLDGRATPSGEAVPGTRAQPHLPLSLPPKANLAEKRRSLLYKKNPRPFKYLGYAKEKPLFFILRLMKC